MDTINRAYKKLTNANGAVRFFSILAFIIGLIGVLLEPLGKLLYNMIFDKKIDNLLVKGFKQYINASQYSIIFFVMTIILMVAAFSSKHKKNIGQGFGSLFVLVPLITSIVPIMDMIDYLKSSTFEYYMKGADNLRFRGIAILMVYVLALSAALLLVLSGLILVCKASSEKPTEITYVPTKLKNGFDAQQGFGHQGQFGQFNENKAFAPANNGFANAQGFSEPNTVGGFGAAPFAVPSENTQQPFARPNENTQQSFEKPLENTQQPIEKPNEDAQPFAKPQENAVPASAPLMDEPKTEATAEIPVIREAAPAEKPEEPVPDQKVCPECGTVLAGNAKFCKNCGSRV